MSETLLYELFESFADRLSTLQPLRDLGDRYRCQIELTGVACIHPVQNGAFGRNSHDL